MDRMYLVTGAAGFLGGTIARQLVERGETVRAFVLPNDKAIKFVPKEAEIVEANLCDKASLERFFDVPSDSRFILIHCASIVTVNPEFSQKVMDVNYGGTLNILEECKARRELGYRTRPYRETMHDEIQWMKSAGLIPA